MYLHSHKQIDTQPEKPELACAAFACTPEDDMQIHNRESQIGALPSNFGFLHRPGSSVLHIAVGDRSRRSRGSIASMSGLTAEFKLEVFLH